MERPESATVVLPAYGVVDAIATVVRDLAVAPLGRNVILIAVKR